MMSCSAILAMIGDFVEESLSEADCGAVREHLSKCGICRHLVHTYDRTRGLCRDALRQNAPAEVGERLLAYLRNKIVG